MSGLEERERAVELYFTTPMMTAQVVEHLGYPTRQCLERWLAMDSRYAGHMAKPIIPLETRRRAVELVLGGMQQKQVFLVKSVFRVSSLIFFGFRHEECRPVVCFTGCPSCRT